MAPPRQNILRALTSLNLTPREAEVLFWISEGKSNHDIGVILDASTGTIRKHVEHIFTKLKVENRTTAAVIALERCRFPRRNGRENRCGKGSATIAALAASLLSELWSDGCEICNIVTALIAYCGP
jgi:DNA-binding CsgD family transcriptional regulator